MASAYVYAVDPAEPGHYPTCLVLATTGFYCPSCGALRSVHALLHGDVVGSLDRHPLVLPSLVLTLLLLVVGALIPGAARRWLVGVTGHPAFLAVTLTVVCVFWVLRNVPGWTWLAPT